MSNTLQQHMMEKFTPEKLARMRMRIGVPQKHRVTPFNNVAHADTIRHFTNGLGYDNPLFCDPAYAAGNGAGEAIA